MASTLPAAEQLWEEFAYNPLTGELFWRQPKRGRQLHRPAGTLSHGYVKVMLNRRPFLGHRIVWAWLTGEDPGDLYIDHIDRNRANNRWWNLRLGSPELNGVNTPGKGYYLVTTERRGKPWRVTRYTETGKMCCERYATEAEAKARADELQLTRFDNLTHQRPIA